MVVSVHVINLNLVTSFHLYAKEPNIFELPGYCYNFFFQDGQFMPGGLVIVSRQSSW